MKRKLLFCISSICVIAMMAGLFMLITMSSMYREGAETYESLMQHLTVVPPRGPVPIQTPAAPEPPDGEPMEAPDEDRPGVFRLPDHIVLPEVNFAALYEINSDVVGWLILEGTPIHYPVVHGSDNVHYLHHLFDGRRSNVGTLFVDTYNLPGFVDRNTIIYGHHMQDGSMFAALENYNSQAFFDANPWIFLLTPEGNYVIQLFAGYLTDVYASSWRRDFADDSDFETWIRERRDRSDFVSTVEVGPTDRVVTLSTCSTVFFNARYVVVGKLTPIA